jgi:flagellar motor protein MotB
MLRFALTAIFLTLSSWSAYAAPADAPRLILGAQVDLNLDRDPSRPPAVFSLMVGDAGFPDSLFTRAAAAKDVRGIKTWQLQVFDSADKKVSFVQGRGEPPPKIAWSGLSREGAMLDNGFYSARLVWKDGAEAVHETPSVSVSLLTLGQMRDFLGPQVSLNYVDPGLVIRIVEGLLFSSGQWKIQQQSEPVLDKIAIFLNAHPGNKLIIQGYSDSQGSTEMNGLISRNRALAVYEHLLARRIDPARITYAGRGALDPIADNATPEGRAKNRRVEILVLKTTDAG